jgi:hypothetical protein
MIKTPDLKFNVPMESTKKIDFWKNLSIKPTEKKSFELQPSTSRIHSKENLRLDPKHLYRPVNSYFRQSGSETHRNALFEWKDETIIEKHSEAKETKLSGMSIFKDELSSSYREKKDDLRHRERDIIKDEQDLKKKCTAFEEERNKWCSHISLKLKEIKIKENLLEAEKKSYEDQIAKSKQIEEAFFKLQAEIKSRSLRLEEAEINFSKREDILQTNEERLAMKMEDIACYEYKVMSYEKDLMYKELELEKIAELIEEKKKDIDKTADMFEKINAKLQLDCEYVDIHTEINKSKQESLKQQALRLKMCEKRLKNHLAYTQTIEINKYFESSNFSSEEIYEQSGYLKEDSEEFKITEFDVRTPE